MTEMSPDSEIPDTIRPGLNAVRLAFEKRSHRNNPMDMTETKYRTRCGVELPHQYPCCFRRLVRSDYDSRQKKHSSS